MSDARTQALEATVPGRLRLWAEQSAERIALREKRFGIWRGISWGDYYRSTSAAAHALDALGVRPGDHVALISDNRPEWLYVDLAAQGIGARSVGVYQTSPATDVAYILGHCNAVVLFCEDQEQVDKAVKVADQTPSVRHVVVFEPRATHDYADPRLMRWSDFIARGEALRSEAPDWFESRLLALDPNAPSMVVYTSGTTGHPKGAMMSSRNVLAQGSLNELLGIVETDIILSYLPLCHVAEKIFSIFIPMISGCVVHFGESTDTVREDIREVAPTLFLGMPRIWEKIYTDIMVRMEEASWLKRKIFELFCATGVRIAERRQQSPLGFRDRLLWRIGDLLLYRPLQERIGLRRCRLPFCGAAPISPDLLRWFHGIGVPILEGYGQTECSGISHFNPPGRMRFGTVGLIAPGLEMRFADDAEILLRGPNVFVGYLHNPEATAAAIDADGWLHTGDIGNEDEHGYLTLTGRKKQIIKLYSGKTISPERIENALKTSTCVNEAVCIGEGRNYITALVQIELDVVGNWAAARQLQYTSFTDLSSKTEVIELIAAEIDKSNDLLAPVEHVKAFRLLPLELNQDEGEITATRKVRRSNVLATYEELVESMYREDHG